MYILALQTQIYIHTHEFSLKMSKRYLLLPFACDYYCITLRNEKCSKLLFWFYYECTKNQRGCCRQVHKAVHANNKTMRYLIALPTNQQIMQNILCVASDDDAKQFSFFIHSFGFTITNTTTTTTKERGTICHLISIPRGYVIRSTSLAYNFFWELSYDKQLVTVFF